MPIKVRVKPTPKNPKVVVKAKPEAAAPVTNKNVVFRATEAPFVNIPQMAAPDAVNPTPLFIPKDTVKNIRIKDTRAVSPTSGKPNINARHTEVPQDVLRQIISHAKAKGIDPYTAMAIAYQETDFGKENKNLGSAWTTYPDEGVEGEMPQNANILVKALKEKLEYAKRLGLDKKGEAFALQAYNGLGKLGPRFQGQADSFYGIPVTKEAPLNLRENPAYGKTVLSLRDLLKTNTDISQLVDETQAYQGAAPATQQPSVKLRIAKKL